MGLRVRVHAALRVAHCGACARRGGDGEQRRRRRRRPCRRSCAGSSTASRTAPTCAGFGVAVADGWRRGLGLWRSGACSREPWPSGARGRDARARGRPARSARCAATASAGLRAVAAAAAPALEHDDHGSDGTGGAHPAERSTGAAPRGPGLGLVPVLCGEDDERVAEAGELLGRRLRARGIGQVEQAAARCGVRSSGATRPSTTASSRTPSVGNVAPGSESVTPGKRRARP